MTTSTTVFSRVTVVAPRTRIDVALPADVAVSDLVPLVVDMAEERTSDGGSAHGGWVLAKLASPAPLEPSRTLAALGVVDGELLQLRKRAENPPQPLFDDVIDAVAEATPDNFRPWTPETAKLLGNAAGGLGLLAAALALFLGGAPRGGYGLTAAIAGGVGALACVAVGATLAKAYQARSTGVVVAAAGGLSLAFVSGFYIVPAGNPAANLLLGSVLVVVVAGAGILLTNAGIAVFIAAATAGTLGALTFICATFLDQPPYGFAGAAAAVTLSLLSVLPRATALLAKLPAPVVPGTAEDLKEETDSVDFAAIERQTSVAHEYMTGLLVGCGAVVSISAVIAATGGPFGVILAVAATLALLLRARTYANGSQAIALVTMGTVAATGIGLGWIWAADPPQRLIWVFGTLALLATAALVVGAVFPQRRFSPPMRRAVEIVEAVCIAIVLPIALGLLGLYDQLRAVGSAILG